jgi:hypothetical protein
MPFNKTEIQNAAIVLIGARTIVSDSDNTKAARLANSLWQISYRGMLELPYNWKFATVREDITGNVTTAPTVGHYDYRYTLPGKCLRVISQIDEYDDTVEYEHRIENYVDTNENSHRCIVTDEDECFIKYIYDLGQDNEIARWPGWFARLVGLDLAILMCEPIKQDRPKKNQLMAMMIEPATGWLARAIQADGMYDADVSDADEKTDRGNRDVIEATVLTDVTRQYIVQRE